MLYAMKCVTSRLPTNPNDWIGKSFAWIGPWLLVTCQSLPLQLPAAPGVGSEFSGLCRAVGMRRELPQRRDGGHALGHEHEQGLKLPVLMLLQQHHAHQAWIEASLKKMPMKRT